MDLITSNQTQHTNSRHSLMITTKSPISTTCNNNNKIASSTSKQFLINKTYNNSRGLSLGNTQSFYLRDTSEDKTLSKTKQPLFKTINSLATNRVSLIKEIEVLKLKVIELQKENKDLKTQNHYYVQQLYHTKSMSLSSLTVDPENRGSCLNKKSSKRLELFYSSNNTMTGMNTNYNNNDDSSKYNEYASVTSLLNTPTVRQKPIISFKNGKKSMKGTQSNMFCLKKNVELNQSVEMIPSYKSNSKSTLTKDKDNDKDKDNEKENSIKDDLCLQLNYIRKRTSHILNMYHKKLDKKVH